jgi:hypothetical protein
MIKGLELFWSSEGLSQWSVINYNIVTDFWKCGSIATQRPGETLLYPR